MLGNHSNSRKNVHISNEIAYNNPNTDNNNINNTVARNIQFLSGCNTDHSDQLSRPNHSEPGVNEHPVQPLKINSKNDLYLHSNYGEVRPIKQGNHRDIVQLTQNTEVDNHILTVQKPIGNPDGQLVSCGKGSSTPKRSNVKCTKRKLFNSFQSVESNKNIVPPDTDLEILLINSCQINAMKVQTIINEFMTEKKYSTIFCMTETKVKGHDFQPIGIKMFSKHRGNRDKKGGGLALGYDEKVNIKMEELETGSNDILAVEGKIYNRKVRLVLCYFDCTKELDGKDYKRNRAIQRKVEDLMGVDPGTALMVLGDINGRLKLLEPTIRASDANGKMVESWTDDKDLIHLNAMDTCVGRYTFRSQNGKSAIDHVLVNECMASKHISMWIDEDKTMLDISDHNLVRVWFKLGNDNHNIKKKRPRKRVTWISRNPVNILKCVTNFKARIGKKHKFKNCMEKLKTAVNHTMKKTKVQKLGGKENSFKRAAPWVDKELIENVNLRSKLSREWRYARKRGNQVEIRECMNKYYIQKGITASMVGDKKGGWEEKKILETLGDPAAFWRMIKLLLGKNKEDNEEAYIYNDEGEKQK